MNKLKGFLLGLALSCSCAGMAQELNARITVNGDKIANANKSVFTTLQNALTEFINNRKWTDATFAVNERIDCSMTIIVNEMEESSFKGEIQVQARRPVYNSSYTTTLLNFRDQQFDFEYMEGEPLEYQENMLTGNLTATVVFYIYIILGLDFDSFSPLGGTAYIQQAQQIVSLAQSQSWSGWKAFDSNRNRHAVATALQDNASEAFRNLWYTYHRKGLDEMAANADRGRTTIIEALPALQEVKKARPTSVLLQMFSDAKLDEIVLIYSKATTQEKQSGYKLLQEIYPTETTKLEALQKN
ncbi:MAG TPA: DUF4835 family protein [Candidatus Parabacteroides intestinipullorum]|jgi:hypothetical protein|uniref:DUF4835 family protein n=1 Tax=Candidatus Parabacteroides intestinipullorum TaxID=2838723 RepID=A0A9D1X7W2_9BACT|nr:DUF4835 family protein [Candidatus Parabacteroides intestinipullorum]